MDHVMQLAARYPALEDLKDEVRDAYGILCSCYASGGKVLVCGNGGSASDAEHIVGELMKGFRSPRPLPEAEKDGLGELGERLQGALPAIALTGQPALSTAYANDVDPVMVFAQQVYGYGRAGDVLLALTTSGNSANVLCAARVAQHRGMKVIGLTGRDGGKLRDLCSVCLIVPGKETAEIQEYHLPIYHTLCAMLEEYFFGDQPGKNENAPPK